MIHGKQIRAAREALGLTQGQLGQMVDNPSTGKPLTASAISQIESGAVRGRAEVILALARAVGLPVGESILSGTTAPNRTLRASWAISYSADLREYTVAQIPEEELVHAREIDDVPLGFPESVWGALVDGDSLPIEPSHAVGPLDELILAPPDGEPVDRQEVVIRRRGDDTAPALLRIVRYEGATLMLVHPDGLSAGDAYMYTPERWEIVAHVRQHRRTWGN